MKTLVDSAGSTQHVPLFHFEDIVRVVMTLKHLRNEILVFPEHPSLTD